MMFDTDVLIWATRGNVGAARVIDGAAERTISIISLMELMQGARSRLDARQIQNSLRGLRFRVLPLSERIGSAASALIDEFALVNGIQVADALIAATAIESGQTLCTGNAKHFARIRALSRAAFRISPK